ncbi:MAG: long-chain fatty acid--CoA ligase [Desulfuromonadales bacterium]|nr:long-chain fatty acid--CoA ligase [Desulfuromonadales bacterium]
MKHTLPRMVLARAACYADHPVFREKTEGRYLDIGWDEFAEQLRARIRGLLAMSVQPGDRVAVMAPNSPQWAWADLAIQSCGGITVPVYHTDGLANTLYILNDSGSRLLFLWSPVAATELVENLDEVPQLEMIILLNGHLDHPRVISLASFLRPPDPDLDRLADERLAAGRADDLASIVYTSGTTGTAKGAMLTHRNFLSNIRACHTLFDISPRDTCLSFLPLSHVFERMAGYYMMLRQGATIAYAEGIDSVPLNLKEVRPTILISVPRLYEKMYARIMERVVSSPWLKRKLFWGALDLCRRHVAADQAGRPVPLWLRLLAGGARKLLYAKLQEPLGGRLRYFVSGGAPLARDVAEFFLAAGIPIFEGYGLTETSPVIAANTSKALRLGTVGRPIPGTRVRIAEDGEILAAGPGIFRGYWKQPEETAVALVDGWFHTGDVGILDGDGFLAITDRKKDLIVTAGGENVAPQALENRLKTDKFIANVLICGDRRPFLTALLVPNFDNLIRYAHLKQIDFLTMCDLVNHPKVLELLRRRVEQLQGGLPGFQQVKRFILMSRDFSAEHGEITPTLKLRRRMILEKFGTVIDSMYLAGDHGVHDSGFCIVDNSSPDQVETGQLVENPLE